jgi:hypothetical protein
MPDPILTWISSALRRKVASRRLALIDKNQGAPLTRVRTHIPLSTETTASSLGPTSLVPR